MNSVSAITSIPGASAVRKARCMSAASAPAVIGSPRTISRSPSASAGRRTRPPPSAGLHRNQRQARVVAAVRADLRAAPTYGRTGPHAQLEHPVIQPVLLHQGAGVLAEIGRQRPSAARRQQASGRTARRWRSSRSAAARRRWRIENRPKAGHPHRTHASDTSTFTGVPVSASSEPACAREHQRHQQLRRRAFQTHRHDDDHRQQRGDGPVDADQRRQHGDQQTSSAPAAGIAIRPARRSGSGRPRR